MLSAFNRSFYYYFFPLIFPQQHWSGFSLWESHTNRSSEKGELPTSLAKVTSCGSGKGKKYKGRRLVIMLARGTVSLLSFSSSLGNRSLPLFKKKKKNPPLPFPLSVTPTLEHPRRNVRFCWVIFVGKVLDRLSSAHLDLGGELESEEERKGIDSR